MGLLAWLRARRGDPAQQESNQETSAKAFVAALSARDPATGEHVNRVACIATEIGHHEGMNDNELS